MNLSRFLIVTQLVMLLGLLTLGARTMLFLYPYIALLFVPSILLCLYTKNEKLILASIMLLFASQHLINSFSHPAYGFAWGSDQWNDYHVAEALSNAEGFQLGATGYTERAPSYSYYILLHLLAYTLSKVSMVPLFFVANFIIPTINSILVSFALYYIFRHLPTLRNVQNGAIGIATILFTTGYYYVHFQSQFVRETFAFPLALICVLYAMKHVKQSSFRSFLLLFVLVVTVVISHAFSSYMLIAILSLLAIMNRKKLMNLAILSIVVLFCWAVFVTFDVFVASATITLQDLMAVFAPASAVISPIMAEAYSYERSLAIAYYLLLGFLGIIGVLRVLKEKIVKKQILPISLAILFVIAMLLRIQPPSRWGYNMALRATIWSGIGLSYIAAIGMKPLLKRRKYLSVLVMLLLALGCFAQNPQYVKDVKNPPPNTYPVYMSALWLRQHADPGSNFLFDRHNIEICYAIEPYSHLRLYHYHDENLDGLKLYKGYIPLFNNSIFSSYLSDSLINVIYDSENIPMGYQGVPLNGTP